MKLIKKIQAFLIAFLIINTLIITSSANSYNILIQNTNTSISINNNTYNAYLLFEAVDNNDGGFIFNPDTCLAVSYTPLNGSPLTGTELLHWLSDSSRTSSELYDFSTSIYNNYIDITPAPIPSGSGKAVDENANISLNVAGYYIVSGGGERVDNHSPITALSSLSVTNPTSTVNPKFDAPTLNKQVYHDNLDSYTKYSDHAIGDNVIYEIRTTVPATTGYTDYNYVITDTLDDGLTFNNDLILTAESSSGTVNIPSSYFTLTKGSIQNNGFTLDIDLLSLINEGLIKTSDTLVAKFSATLNEHAFISPDDTNDNNASLSYSNNPQNLVSLGNTPTSTTKSSTFKIQLTKTNSSYLGLDGAEFVITLDEKLIIDADGKPTNALNFMQMSIDNYIIAPNNYTGATSTTLIAGSINILGLNSNTTYYIHEISPPDGYTLNTTPTYFSLNAEYDTVTGDILPDYPEMYVNSSSTPVEPVLNIINYKSISLPQTGGNSTLIFVLSGILLLITGISLLLLTKRGFKNV